MIKEITIGLLMCATMVFLILASEPDQREVLKTGVVKPVVKSISKEYPVGTFEYEVKRTE